MRSLSWVPVAACLLCGCSVRQERTPPETGPETLFVVREGRHASLLIPLSAGDDPVERRVFRAVVGSADLNAPRFLAWGFGDSRWSLSGQPQILAVLGMLVWPAPGCLSLRFVSEIPVESGERTVRGIRLTPGEMAGVRQVVDRWMDPDGYLGEPLPGTYFWRSRRRFHPFNTCHTFVLEALSASGSSGVSRDWAATTSRNPRPPATSP